MNKSKSDAKKTILSNLNNIINANKNYYESLEFKLINEARIRRKRWSRHHQAILPHVNYPIVRLNDHEYELKLPCWIIESAFDQAQTAKSEKFDPVNKRMRTQRENIAFIRKLISQNKKYFINTLDSFKKQAKDNESQQKEEIKAFAASIILDILSNIDETGDEQSNESKSMSSSSRKSSMTNAHIDEVSVLKCELFAQGMINDLFDELKLTNNEESSMYMSASNKYELPGLVIDRPSRIATSTEDDGEIEGNDTLDDMSSLNSSMGSHCHHLFVHNFFVKRRHSADIVKSSTASANKKNSENFSVFLVNMSMSRSDTLKPTSRLFDQSVSRRHSIGSFNITSSLRARLMSHNEDETRTACWDKTELGQSTGHDLSHKRHGRKGKLITMAPANASKKLITKPKQCSKIVVIKKIKKVLKRCMATIDPALIPNDFNGCVPHKNSTIELYANNLFEGIWSDSMSIISATSKNISENYVEPMLDNLFEVSFHEVFVIKKLIKRQDRFFFRCECEAKRSSGDESASNSMGINCLLAVYCMMIALAECNLNNQITFLCSHLT